MRVWTSVCMQAGMGPIRVNGCGHASRGMQLSPAQRRHDVGHSENCGKIECKIANILAEGCTTGPRLLLFRAQPWVRTWGGTAAGAYGQRGPGPGRAALLVPTACPNSSSTATAALDMPAYCQSMVDASNACISHQGGVLGRAVQRRDAWASLLQLPAPRARPISHPHIPRAPPAPSEQARWLPDLPQSPKQPLHIPRSLPQS